MRSQMLGSATGFGGSVLPLFSFVASLSFGGDSLLFGVTTLVGVKGGRFRLGVSEVSLLGDKF